MHDRRAGRGLAVFLAGLCIAAAAPPGLAARPQTGSPRPSIDERLKRITADVFSGADRVDADIAELKAILAQDPRSSTAHMLLGIAYRTKGSPDLMGEAI